MATFVATVSGIGFLHAWTFQAETPELEGVPGVIDHHPMWQAFKATATAYVNKMIDDRQHKGIRIESLTPQSEVEEVYSTGNLMRAY